ncbi:hypothetical protein AVEN_128653-1 [Araneus ventricosus]|uniref:ribonuclease H n=1 Tax=Araneus ventricosus TaxID=182803 RepID=A0A4Y2L1A7_ARAVE|nr:hypothetical protein AVEN_128653-1 [Araneus ventricosus]
MVKEVYQAILERIILYGVELWYRNGIKMNMKLLQILRYPPLSITKAYRTTSNEALQVLSGCIPIDLKAQMLCELDLKLRGVSDGSVSSGIDFELEEKIIPWEVFRINWSLYKNMCSFFSVFTDGSRMNGRIGGAYVIYYGNDEIDFSLFRLSDNSSVFMAEAFAISKAVDEIIFRKMEYVDLITDSRSTLMSLHSLKEKRRFINNIKRKIANYNGRINLKWVKAHEGTMGNERADFLAKSAIDKEEIDICFGETKSEIKLLAKNKMIQCWQDRWNSSKKGKVTRSFFSKVCLNRVKGDFYLNQIFTGHGIFRTHQSRFFNKSIGCQCGRGVGDITHVLLFCHLWKDKRDKLNIKAGTSLKYLMRWEKFQVFCRFVIQSLLNLELN